MELYYIWLVALLALGISAAFSRRKTAMAFRGAAKRLARILPAFVEMLIMVSVVLALVPNDVIVRYAGGSGFLPTALAALFGSVAMLPGFIAFPLGGVLREQGASYMTLAAFTTTLMMVGFVTFPVEREYMGTRLTVIRNLVQGVGIALLVAVAMGFAYGELV